MDLDQTSASWAACYNALNTMAYLKLLFLYCLDDKEYKLNNSV